MSSDQGRVQIRLATISLLFAEALFAARPVSATDVAALFLNELNPVQRRLADFVTVDADDLHAFNQALIEDVRQQPTDSRGRHCGLLYVSIPSTARPRLPQFRSAPAGGHRHPDHVPGPAAVRPRFARGRRLLYETGITDAGPRARTAGRIRLVPFLTCNVTGQRGVVSGHMYVRHVDAEQAETIASMTQQCFDSLRN